MQETVSHTSLWQGKNSDLQCGWNSFVYSDGTIAVPFDLYIPESYDPQKEYPLQLFLHGDGYNGKNPSDVILGGEATTVKRAVAESCDTILIVPAARSAWLPVPNDKTPAETRYPYKCYAMQNAIPSQQLLAVEKLLDECIQALPVDASRVYLCGYSRGTMASWYLLSKSPEKYAAAIVACGAGDPTLAKSFADVPIWMFMGDADPLVSYTEFVSIYAAYKAAGGEGRFTTCEGGGHGLSKWMLAEPDLITWLYAQKKDK